MAVLNRLDRFHLAMDVIERVPRLGEHEHGEDMPEIQNWVLAPVGWAPLG